MATIQQILSGRNLTGVINGTKSGIPIKIPASFLTPNRTVTGKTGTYFKVDGTRETARIVAYGSKAAIRNQIGVEEVPFSCIHSFEKQAHKPETMMQLLDINSEQRQRMGRSEVVRQTAYFKQLFMNLRIAAAQSALFKFHIYASASGNLLNSSSGALINVDYGVPSSNFNSAAAGVDPNGAGNIVTAKWSAAGTDIIGQITNLKREAMIKTGYPIAYAFYGSGIPAYIAGNTACAALIAGSDGLSREYMGTGRVPTGFMELVWVPAGDAFFVDHTGTVRRQIEDDEVVFTPEPSIDWWECIQGTFPVPMNFGAVRSEAVNIIDGMEEVAGMFSYATGTLDPPTVEQYFGDTFFYALKVPNAVYKFDTHW